MNITGILPQTTLLAEIESLKFIIEDFKVSVTRYMKRALKDEFNARDIDGPGFFQENLTLSNLDEIITQNKVTTNHSTGERDEQVLDPVEDGVSSEDKILIDLKEESDNDYYDAIGEYRNPFISAMTQASIIRDRTT